MPYSASMKKLIASRKYNSGPRGSGFNIGETSFLTDHGGAIPPSVLTYANTQAGTPYRKYLKAHGYTPHPAPMQAKLVEFFVEFLTDPGDLVFDPFGGGVTRRARLQSASDVDGSRRSRRWSTSSDLRDTSPSSIRSRSLGHAAPSPIHFERRSIDDCRVSMGCTWVKTA